MFFIIGCEELYEIPVPIQELTEVITNARFHPNQCNLLAYSTSSGLIHLLDLRTSSKQPLGLSNYLFLFYFFIFYFLFIFFIFFIFFFFFFFIFFFLFFIFFYFLFFIIYYTFYFIYFLFFDF